MCCKRIKNNKSFKNQNNNKKLFQRKELNRIDQNVFNAKRRLAYLVFNVNAGMYFVIRIDFQKITNVQSIMKKKVNKN